MTIPQAARELIDAEISVIPVKRDKRPAIGSWTAYQKEPMTYQEADGYFRDAWGVAVICGEVSGGLECIDFDAHDKNIIDIYKSFTTHEGVKTIIGNNKVYTEQSPRGGFHIIYRYETDDQRDGNLKLAQWEDGTSMIETRGEGGYVVTAPSPGYKQRHGDLSQLPVLKEYERDALIDMALSFSQHKTKEQDQPEDSRTSKYYHTDPVSYFNWYKKPYAKKLLEEAGWEKVNYDKSNGVERWRRPGKDDGYSATWGKKEDNFYVFTSSDEVFKPDKYYTPFQVLVLLRFKGNFYAAINWIQMTYFNEKIPYIRVGTDYYKVIRKPDRYNLDRIELKAWKKEEISFDHGKEYIKKIPRFDDFTIHPDNMNYYAAVDNCYNLYKPFLHKPAQGLIKWSTILMEHVFGEQIQLGMRYMQALYLHPERMLPILVLVSRERQTGKTTFLNWLNMIFGSNMANIAPEDLMGSFNYIYATSNIIAVEETLIEKAVTVEKLKALATGKFLTVNQKFISQYKVPFYGKIILASNNEDKFARIDEEEIRFFVRRMEMPRIINHAIEAELMHEIPAFLHHLTTLPPIDWTRDRSGFMPDEITNQDLKRVKDESKSGLYKDMRAHIIDWFDNHPGDELEVAPIDVKKKWYNHNARIDIPYIINVLKNEFRLTQAEKIKKYTPFNYESKSGKPYTFNRVNFTDEYGAEDRTS